jgi:hypothetical protein
MNAVETSAFRLVRIGRSIFPFTCLEDVSTAYRATIKRLGIGGSETPPCEILDERHEVVGHVSYNGRVWRGEWQPGVRPIYSPDGFYGDPQDLYRLARVFAAKLRSAITADQWRAMCRRNLIAAEGVCASHDFLDANDVMAEAFAEVIGHEQDCASDPDAVIWSKAWSIARAQYLVEDAEERGLLQ